MRCSQNTPQTPAAASGRSLPPSGTGREGNPYERGLDQTVSSWRRGRTPGARPKEKSLGRKILVLGLDLRVPFSFQGPSGLPQPFPLDRRGN